MGNVVVLSFRRFRPMLKLKRPFHVVMVGLDKSGKTAILYRSKLREFVKTVSTTAFNVETIRPFKGVRYKVWDIAGREQNRPLWKAYVRHTDAIIFVVDSTNESRLDEAKEELFNILNCAQLNGAPVLVFANKQDLPNALSPREIATRLCLHDLNSRHLWYVQPSSALLGEGIPDGLRGLYEMIVQWKLDLKRAKASRKRKSLAASRTNSINNIL
ncbi:ADP-ribosylation factor [Exaiptasia diaphana]|uniref:ADP-ribosylation factor-like protein 11 n=1 Tax=Exaiptasia diaphana TaxID=2652724 RepID=A0A913XDM4_EXADI|nr:ADP-ribosylation factor [Exaiptasia diaphana]